MPIRLVIGPASYTLASHVPIFFAMFLSPGIAITVSLGSALGFLIAGLPIVITMRALTHVIFAYIGAKYLQRLDDKEALLQSPAKSQLFSFVIGLIHALGEVIVVSLFFFGALPGAEYEDSFFYLVFLLVGIGTVAHSMIDFLIAQVIWRSLGKQTARIDQRVNN